jgi:aromatic ring-cleaving dioxygenase
MDWIEANRQQIVPRTETALHNVIDEVVGLYQNTLYQLTLK